MLKIYLKKKTKSIIFWIQKNFRDIFCLLTSPRHVMILFSIFILFSAQLNLIWPIWKKNLYLLYKNSL